ncbi:MAG: hemagglutinin repeat-containing protein [Crocinitomicaceae bacterium]|jgi:hypothetical protein|nr:hemagglutinin repeat-containing protein [Crocinitomicaceae bacterium]
MNELLLSLGVNIASSAVYDLLKSAIGTTTTREQLIERIASQLDIKNAKIAADKIIEFAAQNGDITIEGTSIYAADSITMRSASGTKFTLGNNSSSKTSTSEINVGFGAKIEGTGGAKIVQNPDGSISFFA